MEKTNYILELYNQEKLNEMIKDFRESFTYADNSFFNNVKATVEENYLSLYLQDKHYNVRAIFICTDFDCELMAKKDFSVSLNEKQIKKWYLRWMNKNFENYKQDYMENAIKVASEYLGEELNSL